MSDEKINFRNKMEEEIIEIMVRKAIKFNDCPICQAREISEFVESNPWANKRTWKLFQTIK
jgi:hypothetical protein